MRLSVGLLVVGEAPSAGRLCEDEKGDRDHGQDDGDDDTDDDADGSGGQVSVVVSLLDVDANARTVGGADQVLLDVAFQLEAEKMFRSK